MTRRSCIAKWGHARVRGSVDVRPELQEERHHVGKTLSGCYTQQWGVVDELRPDVGVAPCQQDQSTDLNTKGIFINIIIDHFYIVSFLTHSIHAECDSKDDDDELMLNVLRCHLTY